jgi:membrane complex biogenesis BtpA family protein
MDLQSHELFGVRKPIIGGVHLLPLPGTPGYDSRGGMKSICARCIDDAIKLQEGGVDAILFANEADTPYQTKVGPEIVAAMTACIQHAAAELRIPFGINLLLDPVAGIAVAHATGAKFVRSYFTGAYVTDMGIANTAGPEAIRFRRYIGADDIAVFTNTTCAFGTPLAQRPLDEVAHGARVHGHVDGLIVSGSAAGLETDVVSLRTVRAAAGSLPVFVGTGVTVDNVGEMLRVADGAIVASSLKVNGVTLNPVDGEKVKEFMGVVKRIRATIDGL